MPLKNQGGTQMELQPIIYEREGFKKPSQALQALIAEARQKLPKEDRYNTILICRELDNIAFKKYTGDNYINQLKRMGIETTYDYLAKIEWVLTHKN